MIHFLAILPNELQNDNRSYYRVFCRMFVELMGCTGPVYSLIFTSADQADRRTTPAEPGRVEAGGQAFEGPPLRKA